MKTETFYAIKNYESRTHVPSYWKVVRRVTGWEPDQLPIRFLYTSDVVFAMQDGKAVYLKNRYTTDLSEEEITKVILFAQEYDNTFKFR